MLQPSRNPRLRRRHLRTLAWGDEVTVLAKEPVVQIKTTRFVQQADNSVEPVPATGFIEPNKKLKIKAADIVRPVAENDVLKVNLVDVQQGDGIVIESPDGKVILIDGGEFDFFSDPVRHV